MGFESRVDVLLEALAAREPAAMDLGTPHLDEGAPEFEEIQKRGSQAVPYLIARAPTAPAQQAAWIVLALGKIGDIQALEPLRKLRADYQARRNKTMWDFAVIGQINVALGRFESHR